MSEERSLHELLCALVLGEANTDERARVEAALANDPALRAEKARLEATIGLVQETLGGGEVLSSSAQQALFARAAQSVRPPIWARPVFRIAATVALLVGGVFASRGLFTERSEPSDGVARNDRSQLGRLGAKDRIAKADAERSGVNRSLADGQLEKRQGATMPRAAEVIGYGGQTTEEPAAPRVAPPKNEDAEIVSYERSFDHTPDEAAKLGDIGYANSAPMDLGALPAPEEGPVTGGVGHAGSGTPSAYASRRAGGGGAGGGLPGQGGSGSADAGTPSTFSTRRPGFSSVSGAKGYTPRSDDSFFLAEGAQRDPLPSAPENTLPPSDNALGLPGEPEGASGGTAVGAGKSGGEPSSSPAASKEAEELAGIGYASGGESAGPSGPAGPPGSTPGAAGPVTGAPLRSTAAELEADALRDERKRLKNELREKDSEINAMLLAFANGRDDVVQRLRDELERQRGDVSLAACDLILRECRRRPNETPSAMFFRFWGDNPFEYPIADPLSTFSVDVDTASYTLARKYLGRGIVPPKEAIRTEEFVNYFAPDVAGPVEGDFAIHTDLAPSRFGGGDPNRWMMRVVVRGREVSKEARQPLSLTFVVDTSGSMSSENRLELVKHALRLLVAELDVNDSIALVAFSNEARLVLPMTSLASRSVVEVAINGLVPDGSTNAEAGLKLGYAVAAEALHPNAGNRVVLLSDGVANVGVTDQDRIGRDVAEQRKLGIYLNTIGVGMGNHNDVFLEQLANQGDGVCNYVDSEREARRAIVENFTSVFQPIARDVKVQVEFDPKQVESYRLLGYENRAIADRDFRNDAVDAGEVGAGHQVTALYELVRVPSGVPSGSEAPLATVRLRWKAPHGAVSQDLEEATPSAHPEAATEIAHPVLASAASGSFDATPVGYRRAVLVAQFAEFLRRSVHVRGDSLDELVAEAKELEPQVAGSPFSEFTALVEQSRSLILLTLPAYDELLRALDALRERELLLSRYEELLRADEARRTAETVELLEKLENENRALEASIRDLIQQKLGEDSADREDLEDLGYAGEDER